MYLEPSSQTNTQLNHIILAYGSMVTNRHLEQHSKSYLLSIIFEQIDKPTNVTSREMEREIEALYSRILPRSFRRPHKMETYDMPLWIGVPDFPVSKKSKRLRKQISYVKANGGMHYHMVVSHPLISRLDCHFNDYIDVKQRELIGRNSKISKMHCVPIQECEVQKALAYALKSLTRRRCSEDDILILPKSHSELTSDKRLVGKQFHRVMNVLFSNPS